MKRGKQAMPLLTVKDSIDLDTWLPSIISVITLLINVAYYAFGQPKVSYKLKRKERLVEVSEELLTYLSKVVSLDDYSGAPTNIRNYSLTIHMCFKSGSAPEEISSLLEETFQLVKSRKQMDDKECIDKWNRDIKDLAGYLRKKLAKYTGVF